MNLYQHFISIFYIIPILISSQDARCTKPSPNEWMKYSRIIKPLDIIRVFRDGNAKVNFPSLNLYKVDSMSMKERLNSTIIYGRVRNVSIEGLFEYHKSTIKGISDDSYKDFRYTAPVVRIFGNHDLTFFDGLDGNVTSGDFRIILRGVEVIMKIKFEMSSTRLIEMDIVRIKKFDFQARGIIEKSIWRSEISKSLSAGDSPLSFGKMFSITQNIFNFYKYEVRAALQRKRVEELYRIFRS